MILPELKGKPRVFIKNNSEALKNLKGIGEEQFKNKGQYQNRDNIGKDKLFHIELRIPFINVNKHDGRDDQ